MDTFLRDCHLPPHPTEKKVVGSGGPSVVLVIMAFPTSHFGEGATLFRFSLTQAFGPLLCVLGDTPVQ